MSNASLQVKAPFDRGYREIVTRSPLMREVVRHAGKVANADISVLISGASGTGKEVMARYIHTHSKRHAGPFIAINCAAIPETMLEATLFGYEKGSFTGASERRVGKFEQAQSGTLLLDEITEMPLGLQAKILRVLQEREVERLGSHKVQEVDVRVIATTNRNLTEAVEDGFMREDLYYRLSVFPLQLPDLKTRSEDILPLAEVFLDKYGAAGKKFSAAAKAQLQTHIWPGNVRELENVVQRGLVLADGDIIDVTDLQLAVPAAPVDTGLHAELKSTEDELLLRTLRENQGVRKETAQSLGISERTLRYKLADLRQRGIQI